MTVTAGCDVGSLTAKVVLMRHNRILGSSVVRSRVNPRESAEEALRAALTDSGLSRDGHRLLHRHRLWPGPDCLCG